MKFDSILRTTIITLRTLHCYFIRKYLFHAYFFNKHYEMAAELRKYGKRFVQH